MHICQSCFERCEIVEVDASIDYAGTHCTGGIGGTHHQTDEVSDCCGEPVNDVDEDLVLWHEDLVSLAKKSGVEWMTHYDPESHKEAFDNGWEVEEELARLIDLWESDNA